MNRFLSKGQKIQTKQAEISGCDEENRTLENGLNVKSYLYLGQLEVFVNIFLWVFPSISVLKKQG